MEERRRIIEREDDMAMTEVERDDNDARSQRLRQAASVVDSAQELHARAYAMGAQYAAFAWPAVIGERELAQIGWSAAVAFTFHTSIPQTWAGGHRDFEERFTTAFTRGYRDGVAERAEDEEMGNDAPSE